MIPSVCRLLTSTSSSFGFSHACLPASSLAPGAMPTACQPRPRHRRTHPHGHPHTIAPPPPREGGQTYQPDRPTDDIDQRRRELYVCEFSIAPPPCHQPARTTQHAARITQCSCLGTISRLEAWDSSFPPIDEKHTHPLCLSPSPSPHCQFPAGPSQPPNAAHSNAPSHACLPPPPLALGRSWHLGAS